MDTTPEEQSILDTISSSQDRMVSTLVEWSHLNSGSKNAAGLAKMRIELAKAFQVLPGEVSDISLSEGSYVEADGTVSNVIYEPSLLATVRPTAPIQIVFTGHYDTVFPENSHFQATRMIDNETMNGPGVADMKGGILVMLEALKAFESHPSATQVGYNILLSPDEEIGSPGSAPILHKLGQQADIGLTYEPALADGSMAGARKGSGNFALIVKAVSYTHLTLPTTPYV